MQIMQRVKCECSLYIHSSLPFSEETWKQNFRITEKIVGGVRLDVRTHANRLDDHGRHQSYLCKALGGGTIPEGLLHQALSRFGHNFWHQQLHLGLQLAVHSHAAMAA